MIKRVYEKAFWLFECLCKIALVLQVISTTTVVIGRQVFSKTPAWGEELTLFLMVWLSLVGAIILLKEDGHIAVTAFDPWIPKKVLRAMDFLSYAFLGFYGVIMLIYGVELVKVTALNVMPALKIKSGWLYTSIPVSAFIMLCVVAEKFYHWFQNNNNAKEV